MLERLLDWLTAWMYRVLGPLIALSHRFLDKMPRPLDPFRSIKLKLSVLLAISGGTGLFVFWLSIGWVEWKTASPNAAGTSTSAATASAVTSFFSMVVLLLSSRASPVP